MIIVDEDTSSYSASISLIPDNPGPFYIEVYQVSAQCSGYTYSLIYNYTAPTSTPTATPTGAPGPTSTPAPGPTWMTGFDQYEPNFEFDLATTIAPGLSYQMNFIPWGGADFDNDYLKVRVKPGLQLTCETSDLDPAVDPRMVFYNGPGDQFFVMANDDIALGDFNSRLSYYANYEGFVYILVGQGTRMARRDTVNSSYTISCNLEVPGQPTPAPGQPTPVSKAPEYHACGHSCAHTDAADIGDSDAHAHAGERGASAELPLGHTTGTANCDTRAKWVPHIPGAGVLRRRPRRSDGRRRGYCRLLRAGALSRRQC